MIIDTDRYWVVAGAGGRIYSSARNVYVEPDDEGYTAWRAAWGDAAPIASEAELWDVLAARAPGHLPAWLFNGATFVQPSPGQFTPTQLRTYANLVQWATATGGRSATIGGTEHRFDTKPDSFSLLTSKALRLSLAGAPATVRWQFGPTEDDFAVFETADFIAAATAIADFVQETFDSLAVNVLPAITSGAITTPAAIDAAFASL